MIEVLGQSSYWVQHNDTTIRKSIHQYRVGLWVLFVEFLPHDAFVWSVKFAPSGGSTQLSIDELPPSHEWGQVRGGWASTLDGALQEAAFAYRDHHSFIQNRGEFDIDAALERANSEEIQIQIGDLPITGESVT